MEVKAALKPGKNGRKGYTRQYGDQLVCVRYRYAKGRQKRLTTVELIVDEQDWIPGTSIPPDQVVPVRIAHGETELREDDNRPVLTGIARRSAGNQAADLFTHRG